MEARPLKLPSGFGGVEGIIRMPILQKESLFFTKRKKIISKAGGGLNE